MPSDDYMSDDFVANLMAKDAKESTIRYSALGLQALLPKRPTTNAPKPNTRFLKNIIRETDSHNAALKSREVEEAKLRLRSLREERQSEKSLPREGQYKDNAQEERERHHKRRRLDRDISAGDHRRNDRQKKKLNESYHRAARDNESSRHHHREISEDGVSDSEQSSRPRRRHHRRLRQRSTSRSRSRSPHRSYRDRELDRGKHRRRGRSKSHERDSTYRDSHRKKRSSPSPISNGKRKVSSVRRTSPSAFSGNKSTQADDADSDPLEAIIGPAHPSPPPKVTTRGRGAFAPSSTIDTHFSANYDPTADVRPNSDSENDWDQALEALRDRQRWQKLGADRLRAAGFTEEEVSKWETGGEKKEEDVRWKGRGEGREWDRGKVVDSHGDVDTKPEWGRLKGT